MQIFAGAMLLPAGAFLCMCSSIIESYLAFKDPREISRIYLFGSLFVRTSNREVRLLNSYVLKPTKKHSLGSSRGYIMSKKNPAISTKQMMKSVISYNIRRIQNN